MASTSHKISPDRHSSARSRKGPVRLSDSFASVSEDTLAHRTTATGNRGPSWDALTSAMLNWPVRTGGTRNQDPQVCNALSSGVRAPPRSRKGQRPTLSLHFHAAIWLRLHGIFREGGARCKRGRAMNPSSGVAVAGDRPRNVEKV